MQAAQTQAPGAADEKAEDILAEIERLRRELNAVILAHYYQIPEIQDLADFVGDSLALAQQAARTHADVIVFCGVHFMAETAKILNPDRLVLMPDAEAGCSLAAGCPAEPFRRFIEDHPGHLVVSYINCSAAVKALSDVIVTSSNAVKIVSQLPPDQPVIFAPDRNLGRWVEKQTGRRLVLWDATCIVHEIFSAKKAAQLKVRHPDAQLIAHPECEEAVLALADFIGSTSALLRHVQESPARAFIVATEPGIIHKMKQAAPGKEFIVAPWMEERCNCADCPYMKMNTLEKLHRCLSERTPQVDVPEPIRSQALRPIQRMLEMS
ncbi:MAG: quinolinate synthase NadA [Candidatus Sumerlaeia bacterium]